MGKIYGLPALLGTVEAVRLLWIGGRFGGGKSMLAFEIAYQLAMRHRDHVVYANNYCAFAERLIPKPFQYVIAVVDEGGIFFSTRASADVMLAALRKLNLMVLLPSVQPPTSRLRTATCFRVFDGYTMGLPFWVYVLQSNTQGFVKDTSMIVWWRPLQHVGAYSTKFMPVDDWGMAESIEDQLPALKNRKSRHGGGGGDDGLDGLTSAIDDMITQGVQVSYDKRRKVR